MKRQIIAVALGSLFALPAFADGEIGFEYWKAPMAESSMTRAEVVAELVAAQRAGHVVVDGEIGTLQSAAAPQAGKTRNQVLAELITDRSDNNFSVDGETGDRIPRS
jgi:hypothetical protein